MKAFAAIGVVLIHFSFPGDFGRIIQLLARFGVPFFFMVSGYFCYKSGYDFTMRNAIKKSIHITKIAAVAVAIYLIGNVVLNGFQAAINELSLSNILKLIIFNAPQMTSAHLWFLFALIYAYILLAFILRILNRCIHGIEKSFLVISAVLLVIHVGLSYAFVIIGRDLPHPLVRNAYVFALPFLLLGYYLHMEKAKIKMKSRKIPVIAVVGGGVYKTFYCNRNEHGYSSGSRYS